MSRRLLLALPVALATVLLALSGGTAPVPTPTVDPLPPAVTRLAATTANEWSGGWATATTRGNRGRGIAVALIDPTHPDGLHIRQMHDVIGETCPDVSVYRATSDPAEVYRLCQPPIGCSVVCCRWTIRTPGTQWDAAFRWAAQNGVLVFCAAGNEIDPVLSPDTIACAAVSADGQLDRLGSPPTGRIDAVVFRRRARIVRGVGAALRDRRAVARSGRDLPVWPAVRPARRVPRMAAVVRPTPPIRPGRGALRRQPVTSRSSPVECAS